MDPLLESVLDDFRIILKVDGGALDLVSQDDGVVTLRYVPGHNEKCPECVLTPEQLRDLVKESLQTRVPYVEEVVLV